MGTNFIKPCNNCSHSVGLIIQMEQAILYQLFHTGSSQKSVAGTALTQLDMDVHQTKCKNCVNWKPISCEGSFIDKYCIFCINTFLKYHSGVMIWRLRSLYSLIISWWWRLLDTKDFVTLSSVKSLGIVFWGIFSMLFNPMMLA